MKSREELFLSTPEAQRLWMRRLTIGCLFAGPAFLIMAVTNVYSVVTAPDAEVVAIDSSLRIRQLVTTSEYQPGEKEILSWMIRCVMDATSFSFDKYEREKETARACFTETAWVEYFDKLKNAGGWEQITGGRTNVSGAPAGYPQYQGSVIVDDKNGRQYLLPFIRTWENQSGRRNQNHIARIVIVPVSPSEAASGYKVVHLSLGSAQ